MAKQPKLDGRAERSRRTRARVVEAATRLFVEHGYVATTIEDVAEAAGVAVQTVYYLFGNKPTLLARVLDVSIVGDLEPVPVLERPWVDAVRRETDGAAAVEQLVAESVAIIVRVAPVYEVVRRASADPDVATLLEENRRLRRQAQREFMAILQRSGHLNAGVTLETAADLFYGIINEDVFQLLVGDCGWRVARFRKWATALMLRELT